jgi:hypothetical protein
MWIYSFNSALEDIRLQVRESRKTLHRTINPLKQEAEQGGRSRAGERSGALLIPRARKCQGIETIVHCAAIFRFMYRPVEVIHTAYGILWVLPGFTFKMLRLPSRSIYSIREQSVLLDFSKMCIMALCLPGFANTAIRCPRFHLRVSQYTLLQITIASAMTVVYLRSKHS